MCKLKSYEDYIKNIERYNKMMKMIQDYINKKKQKRYLTKGKWKTQQQEVLFFDKIRTTRT